jgi:hypothetical protein
MKTLLLLVSTALPLVASAQIKKTTEARKPSQVHKPAPPARQSPGLDGIGLFRIGVTDTTDLQAFAKSKGTFVGVMEDEADVYTPTDETKIALVVPSEDGNYTVHSTLCPKAQVYYLSSYEVAGIRLSEVYLTFYSKKLIEFKCEYSSELVDALTLKYGKPKTDIKERPRNCVFVHTGNKITYKDVTTRESWENGGIHASATIMKWYDSSCEKHLGSYFAISNSHQVLTVYSCSEAQEKARAQVMQQQRKKKLSDL